MDAHQYPVACEYRRRNPQGHWFDDDTMRFFGTRLGSRALISGDYETGTWYFVTSEKPPHGPRRCTVRVMDAEGSIGDIGGFCKLTRSQANRLLEKAHARGVTADLHRYGRYMLERLAEGDLLNARGYAKAAGLRLNFKRDGSLSSITGHGHRWTSAEDFARWALLDA